MADEIIVNGNLCECSKNVEEFRRDSCGDIMPCGAEIMVMKTEVIEECYDFEISVDDKVFMNVNEEYNSSLDDYSEKGNLEHSKKAEPSLSEDVDDKNGEFSKAQVQENKYKCDQCLSEFDKEIYLKSHYQQCTFAKKHAHLKDNIRDIIYMCAHCMFSSTSKYSFQMHTRTHAENKRFKCTYKICKCTPEQQESCKCDTCEYAATKKSGLKKHLLKHTTKSKEHKCSECKYVTYRKSDLTRHLRTHTNEKPFKCTYKNCKCAAEQKECCDCGTCEYRAKVKAHLTQHILVNHSVEPKRYKCKDCKYAAHTRASLVLHHHTHTGDRPFKCTYTDCICPPGQKESCQCAKCAYAAITSSRLNNHVLVAHNPESRKYKCSKCQYATRTKEALRMHVRTHADYRLYRCTYKNCKCTPGQDKPCVCDICSYATTKKRCLSRHILMKHSTEQRL